MSVTHSFEGRRVLITGGAQGIGRAVAQKFLESKASVTILDQDDNRLKEIKNHHPQIITLCADLSDWESSRKIIKAESPFHHLVNNAGVGRPAEPLMEFKPQSIDGIFGVNFKALVNVTQAVSEGMIASNFQNATIVNMSSISDTVAVAGLAVYSCSKAAVTMFTKCVALELGEHGIRINCVRPAMVKTEQVGRLAGNTSKVLENVTKVNERKVIKRRVEMTEVADAVLFLSSSASSMVNGSDILLDGGLFTS